MDGRGWDRETWTRIKWLARLGVLGAVLLAVLSVYEHAYITAAVLAIIGWNLLGFQETAQAYALGWLIDENGERQKIQSLVNGRAVFTPTTQGERIAQEAVYRDNRRRSLMQNGLQGWGLLIAGLALWQWHYLSDIALFMCELPLGLFALMGLFEFFGSLRDELLYQMGNQNMVGAKVLDSPPVRPGREEVLRQKAHGDARTASEAEVRAAGAGVPHKSSLHEREF